MASSLTNNEKLSSTLQITAYDFDPGATTATDIAWVPMGRHFLAMFFRTVGASGLTFSLIGNTATDGTGTDVTIVSHAVANEPDAVGDYVFLECSEEQVKEVAATAGLSNVKTVSASVAVATGTDEGVVIYVREPHRKYADITAESVA